MALTLTGERLWLGFSPKYLEGLGAGVFIIGLFDALQTLLGALYACPGGWLTDRGGNADRCCRSMGCPSPATYWYFDNLIRFCERLPFAFVILWAMNHSDVTAAQFGVLTAIEMGTTMVCYIPVAHLADRHGQRPFVFAAFIFSSGIAWEPRGRSWARGCGASARRRTSSVRRFAGWVAPCGSGNRFTGTGG